MSNNFFLEVNSKDRISGDINNFRYQLNNNLLNINEISVVKLLWTNSIYNINETNNILYWTDSLGVEISSEISKYEHSITSLTSAIQTAMNNDKTDTNTYTCSYNSNTMKITITSSDFNFILRNNINYKTKGLAKVLGYNNEENSGSTSYIASDNIRLAEPYYEIRSDIVKNNTYIGVNKKNTLYNITNVGNYGDIIDYPIYKQISLEPKQTPLSSEVYFKIYDQYGNNISVNRDYIITLKLKKY
jgi:hypothetical protein